MKLDTELKEIIEVKIEDAVFKIKPLDMFTLQNIESKYEIKGKIPKEKQGDYNAEILQNSIVNWQNIYDKNGEVKFSREKIRPLVTILFQIKPEVVEKLVKAATYLIKIQEQEKKKSKTSSNSLQE